MMPKVAKAVPIGLIPSDFFGQRELQAADELRQVDSPIRLFLQQQEVDDRQQGE